MSGDKQSGIEWVKPPWADTFASEGCTHDRFFYLTESAIGGLFGAGAPLTPRSKEDLENDIRVTETPIFLVCKDCRNTFYIGTDPLEKGEKSEEDQGTA